MVLSYDTSDDRFGAYAKRQQQASLDKYQAPARAWDKLQNLQNQAVAGQLDSAGEQEFKEARRKWNREYKNTPVGIMASGVNLDQNPFGAQDLYHDMSAHLYHDKPKLYDRMYPFNPGRLISAAAENIGPMSWLKRILPKGERKVPENVRAMRERFPGMINEIIPPSGIAPLIPEHIRNSTLNKLVSEDEGIFGRGDLPPDFDYEADREGRERSEKIAFLESINSNIDYDNVDPALIDELYERALEKAAQEEEFMQGNIGVLNPLQPD